MGAAVVVFSRLAWSSLMAGPWILQHSTPDQSMFGCSSSFRHSFDHGLSAFILGILTGSMHECPQSQRQSSTKQLKSLLRSGHALDTGAGSVPEAQLVNGNQIGSMFLFGPRHVRRGRTRRVLIPAN